ncbi:putative E3 ubiquitin-protein ligase Topors [Nannochloris sp. 'desiccata']|nr:putative E3 ubiquitin-protein ligase Topors [Chlorella desiccata (nom. nud.)]
MESIGTCPICLTDISAADEAFIEPCLHHFCFRCLQAWVRTQQNQASPVTCPVCKTPFNSIIYDCHDVAYRVWSIDDAPTSTGKHLDNRFGLTSEQRRRRSRYSAPCNQVEEEQVSAVEKGNTLESRHFEEVFVTLKALSRPAVAQWLIRELQALLLQEDVDLLAHHIVGNLKHGIEASVLEKKRLKKLRPGRLEGDKAVEVVAAAMVPYFPEYGKKLGQEFVEFIISGLNIDAHDAVVFRIKEEEAEEEEGIG